MARITIEKYSSFNGEYWTNIYWTAGTIGDAGSVATALINAEKALYPPQVTITKTRIDDGVPNTDMFATVVINTVGTRSSSADFYPFFAVLRVDFSVSGQGRPCRKYLRGVLQESDANGLVLAGGILTAAATYASAVVAAGVTDPQGSAITSGAAFTQVGMRQLRRGSKKTVTP